MSNEIALMREIAKLQSQIDALRTIEVGGVWQSYTPTWTATTTNPSIGDGTLSGRYTVIGKLVVLNIRMVAGSTTTFGSGEWNFSLPIAASSAYGAFSAKILDFGIAWYNSVGKFASTTSIYIPPVSATYPMTWGVNDLLELSMNYEV